MPFELTLWQILALLAKLISYSGCFTAVGFTLYMLATPNLAARIGKSLLRGIWGATLIGGIGAVGQFFVQSGRLLDDGFVGMFDPDMMTLVANAPLGESVIVRLSGLALLIAFAFNITASWLFGALGALATAASFSFVGHGTGEPWLLLASLVTVHLLGISFWLGALWPLHRATLQSDGLGNAATLAYRFGLQASWVVGCLVVAGGVLIWFIVGSPFNLLGSQYGLTLVAKLVFVTALLSLAALNKLRLVPALQAGGSDAALRLRQSIALETAAFAIIFVITAVLTTVTPLPETMDMNT